MINKILKASILLFCLHFVVNAQNITIQPSNATISGTTDDWDIVASSMVNNLSGNNLNLIWKRTNVNTPPEWKTAICDNNVCHGSSTDSFQFSLTAGSSGQLLVHFFLYNTPGNGSIQLTVYEVGNSSNMTTATYDASAILAGINDGIIGEKISYFPNPAKNFLTVQFPTDYLETVELFNILGVRIKSFKTNGSNSLKISLTELSSGIYFLRFRNDEGKVITRNFVKE